MSAFAGYISFSSEDPPPQTEARLQGALDAKGLEAPRTCRAAGGVFVFRQHVLSPEDRFEHQPAVGGGGYFISLFDGRLDNRGDLITALGLVSPTHAPLPDGSIALAAYERWAEEAVPRLLGDFAWAVWNGRERRLMLARDHSPMRALFHCRIGDAVAFATGYRPLLALPQAPRELDELTIVEMLLSCAADGDRSFYKGISWVGAAARVVVTPGAVVRDRTWEPVGGEVPRPSDDAAVEEEARELFEQAVACRMRLAGAVVTSVSGGLDSSAVAATAARRLSPATVHALCVVPVDGVPSTARADRYANERPLVEILAARHPNLSVEYLASSEPEPFELDPGDLFAECCLPVRAPGNFAWFSRMRHRAVELGAGTILLGGFGNMTLSASGMDRLSDLRQDGAWATFTRELLAVSREGPPGSLRRLALHHAIHSLPRGVAARLRAARQGAMPDWYRMGALNPDFAQTWGIAQRYERDSVMRGDYGNVDGRRRFLRRSIHRSRMVMEANAAMRALTGITASDPFYDRRLIDFCLALPADQFLRNGRTRSLARRVFADRLPPALINNNSRGLQNSDWHRRLAPHRDRFAAELANMVRSPLASGMLDLPRLRRMFESWATEERGTKHDDGFEPVNFFLALHLGRFLRWIEAGSQ